MTDARAHVTAQRLKPLVMLTALVVIMTGCTSKSKTYSYNFESYQGFSTGNHFISSSEADDSEAQARLLADAEENVLSVNLFDNTPVHKQKISNEELLSANLFDLTPIHQSPRRAGFFDRMVRTASAQLGTPYRSGGCNPNTGFDCSGFTTWVFQKYGIHLPRSSREQFQSGTLVAKNRLRKGDLVFFRSKRGINHVGIYLANGKFIHSASRGKTVTISRLDGDYWRTHYAGGRRVF